jgi:hypothetical protein
MAKVRPCSLVIDASLTHAAGDRQADQSRQCTAFLQAVQACHHRLVVAEPWLEEWHHHHTRFARAWLRAMYARRLVVEVAVAADPALRRRIERAAGHEKVADILLKDLHLIEAALASDKRIASLDDRARSHFRQAANSVALLRDICWVNPCNPDEEAVEWLRAGAPAEKHRKLGYVPPED